MNRRELIQRSAAWMLGSRLPQPSAASEGTKKQPNVLILLPDQLRAQSLGCYGNTDVRTPHIDSLASQGTLLTNTIANSPVCGPARGVILTGTYASTCGLVANDLRLREDVPSIAACFANAGYRTGYIGKWHLDGGARNPGFVPADRRHGFQFWAANECSHKPYGNTYFHDTPDPLTSTKFEPEMWADEAIQFLESTTDQPFFLIVSTGAPHDPYIAPPKYMDMYEPSRLKMRANWQSVKGGTREDVAGYYACITALDDQVGRILSTLREKDLEQDTIVLFSSDHGNMLGSQSKTLKQKPWEESINVPGILRYPGRIGSSKQNETIFSHVDFAPTLLTLCSIPVPRAMQGSNKSSALLRNNARPSEPALLQIFGPAGNEGCEGWRGLRTGTHLYARTKTSPWLLYDLKRDPFQQHNLIADASSKALCAELDYQLKNRMKSIGDAWQTNWSESIGNGLDHFKPFESVQEYLRWRAQQPRPAS